MTTFNNEEMAKQLISFEDFNWGRIYPTDIDAFIDFRGKLFVAFEVKKNGNDLPVGQRRALEEICKKSKIPTYVFVVSHDIEDPKQNILLKDTVLIEVFEKNKWRICKECTPYEAVGFLLKKHNIILPKGEK